MKPVTRMRPAERKALLQHVAAMLAAGELQLGDAARLLRASVLRLSRDRFSEAVGVSKRAIAKLEDDPKANPTLDTLVRVFAPFGARVSLVFPGLESPPLLSDEAAQQRSALRSSLAQSHRRKRRR